MTAPIRLLLADDQALVRGALAALLGLEPDLEVVAEVGVGRRGGAGRARAPARRVPAGRRDARHGRDRRDGAVRAALPSTRVLIVTTFGRPGYLRRALQAGASGFVVKDTPAASSPTPCAASTRACGWSTRRWRPTAWSPASPR